MPHHLNGQPVQERWSSQITWPWIWGYSDPLKHCYLFTHWCGVTSQKMWITSTIWKLQICTALEMLNSKSEVGRSLSSLGGCMDARQIAD